MKLLSIRPELSPDQELNKILLLIDYNNVLYRSYFSAIRDVEIYPWLPIVRFLDSIRLLIQRVSVKGIPIEFIFAGESRTKLNRSNLNKDYKAQRAPMDDSIFRSFRKILGRVLEDMGTELVSRNGAEADDVIASVVNYVCPILNPPWMPHEKKISTDVVIYSNDKDLYQLLSYDRCYIYKYPGVFYTIDNFEDQYGFHPSEFTSYKAMVGDRSDNIKGVNGIGPVRAREHILNSIVPNTDPDYLKALELVTLNYDLDVPDVGDKLYFDFDLSRSKPVMLDAYGDGIIDKAFTQVQLALKMLAEVYENGYN